MKKVTIFGSGMAGMGAAYQVRQSGYDAVMFEQDDHFGGHTASHQYPEGFTFDEGPHISFTADERIQNLFAENVNNDYQTLHAYVNNYWKGHWVKHPAQCNLHGLPSETVVEVLKDFIEAQHADHGEIKNYRDWLYASFGRAFAENFPMKYTRKYHTTDAENLTTDWLGPRLYRPKIEEILRGAISAETEDVHYIKGFRYPTHNGFVSYLKPLAEQTDIQLGHKVISIDVNTRQIEFANGKNTGYEHIVSSIPLPELIPLIKGAPKDVLESAEKLACSQVVVVNIGVNRPDLIEAFWTYFYDEDIIISRLSTPHMQSPNNVPEGCGSLQAECYFSEKYKPLNGSPDDCIPVVIEDLKKVGVLRDDDNILFKNTLYEKYANVIFDHDRNEALSVVHGYLDDIGIAYCGRYGDWEYIWTDESFKSGENAARKIIEKAG